MVAQSYQIKQRNLVLEKRFKDNSERIRALEDEKAAQAENFAAYQKQSKKDKHELELRQFELEQQVKNLE